MSVNALIRRQVNKTASYTLVAPGDRTGTTFTNLGASGSITFTLPAASAGNWGSVYRFLALADQTIVVQPPVADTGISLNDLAIDTLAIQTGSGKIGACIEASCVQMSSTSYQWVIVGVHVGFTYTLAS